jgi:hypothetical protein
MAAASYSSGSILAWWGWDFVAAALLPPAALALAMVAWLMWVGERKPSSASTT